MGSALDALSAGVNESLRRQFAEWHAAGVQAVHGETILPRFGAVTAHRWHFRRGDRHLELPLPEPGVGGRLRLIGLGKAALGMARGFRASLRACGVDVDDGLLIVRDAPKTVADEPWRVHVGDHPIPGPASLRAAQALLEFIEEPRAQDVYVVLLSGGASALCALPAAGVTLEEKIRITREEPAASPDHNLARAIVDDVIYLGTHTRFWLRSGEYRIAVERQHNRFVLDERPITWNDEVWVQWHADDGYMLERYAERDEALMAIPPRRLGEGDAPPEATRG